MKKFCILPLIAALAFFVSCPKQQTEEEKKAEVERLVQERVAAERLQDEKQRLAQEKANLEAREKALADRENAAAATTPAAVEEPAATPVATEPPQVVREKPEIRTEKRSTAAYGTFYRKLESFGAWRETADYGYVWQPREAEESRDWRPYTEGHWVYTDAGWTWISDESFGWATYHYGRWLRLRRVGWVWVPGDEWAPAWVSWRTSRDYVGWAPLPPEARFDRRSGIHNWADNYYDIGPDQYAFVPNNEFSSPHVRRAVVPAERNVTIVIETTNVTNITFANATIVNEGPNFEEMRSRSQRPMERYRLRRQSNGDTSMATVRGLEIEMSVPLIIEVRDMPRPRTVRERVTDVTIDTGWNAIVDRAAADRARRRIRADATPPPNLPPKIFVKPVDTTPAPTAAATATATPAATKAPTATPTATVATTATATPTATKAPTPTVAPTATAAATASPAATVTAAATATPAASPTVRPSPSPTAIAEATATPAASPTVRTRPSPTAAIATPAMTTRPSPTATIAAMATPAASSTVRTLPSPTIAAIATPAVSPSVRTRPSPAFTPRVIPSVAPTIAATPSAPVRTPVSAPTAPVATVPPSASPFPSVKTRPSPSIPVRATPSITPRPVAPPVIPTESVAKPLPTFAPVTRPTPPPRATPPPPVATPPTSDAPPPPVATPPVPAITPAPAPNLTDEKAKATRPKRPGEIPTPTPAASTAPE